MEAGEFISADSSGDRASTEAITEEDRDEARAAIEAGTRAGQTMPPSAALEETLHLLSRVVRAAVTSIVVTNPRLPDNPIVYHNPAFELISGYSAREIDGHNCRFLQGEGTDPGAIAEIRAALRSGQPFHGTLLNYRKDGTPFWNELAISPVHDDAGALTHFVGVQHDVTRRTEAEQERDALLEQQQRIVNTLQRALLLTPAADVRRPGGRYPVRTGLG